MPDVVLFGYSSTGTYVHALELSFGVRLCCSTVLYVRTYSSSRAFFPVAIVFCACFVFCHLFSLLGIVAGTVAGLRRARSTTQNNQPTTSHTRTVGRCRKFAGSLPEYVLGGVPGTYLVVVFMMFAMPGIAFFQKGDRVFAQFGGCLLYTSPSPRDRG